MKKIPKIQSNLVIRFLWLAIFAFLIIPAAWAQTIPATLSWTGETQGIIFSSPVIDNNGIVYVGSNDNNLTAFNTDGSIKWTFTTGNWVDSSPALSQDGSTIYAGSWDNHLYALNSDDGSLNWSFETNSYITSSPAVDLNGRVYFGSMDSIFYALESNGSLAWEYFVGQPVFSSPAIGENGSLYFGDENGTLHAVNPDGTVKWTYEVEDVVDTNKSILSSPAVDTSGNIYFGSGNGFCYSLSDDGDSASLNWKYETGDRVDSSPVLGINEEVFFVSRDGYMRSLPTFSATTENLPNWEVFVGDVFYSTPVVDENGRVYVIGYTGGGENHLFAYDANGSKAWDSNVSSPPFEIPSVVDSSLLLSDDGKLYFGCFDKKLYCVDIGIGPANSDWPMFGRTHRRDSDWPAFTLSISANTGGTVTASGMHYLGTNAFITATPNTGYSFDGWSGEGVADPSQASTTVSITRDRSVSASFSINSYSLTVEAGNGGSVTGSGTFVHGSNPSITATPDTGYSFAGWAGEGVSDANASITSVSMITTRTITAIFSLNSYELTVLAGNGGTVTGTGTFNHGTTPIISATASNGYTFSGWAGEGIEDPNASTTKVVMSEDRNISALFSLNSYPLTVIAGTGGTVSGAGTYTFGSTPSISATPSMGYLFDSWSGDGVVEPYQPETTVDMQSARTVSASFYLKSYTLNILSGAGGTVSGTGSYPHGTLVQIEATAEAGYSFEGWTGEAISDPDAPLTSILMNADQNISAGFTANPVDNFLLTLTASPTKGGILLGGGNYQDEQNVSISAIPQYGYSFDRWSGYTLINPGEANNSLIIESNLSLTAHFEPLAFSLDVQAGLGGNSTGSGNYTYQSDVNISAEPLIGYSFSHWEGNGTKEPFSAETTFNMVSNVTLRAIFIPQLHSLSIGTSGDGQAAYIGNNPFAYGSSVRIDAVPSEGYVFSGWVGENIESPESSSTTILIQKDSNITANFEPEEKQILSLIVLQNISAAGTITGGGFYEEDQYIQISAASNPGYRFSHWLGSGIENPLAAQTTIFLRSDSLATASFALSELSVFLKSEYMGSHWFASWFGTIYQTERGWIYHTQLGWLYPELKSSGIWIWKDELGWLWTNERIYSQNFLWHNDYENWIYLNIAENDPLKYYDYGSGTWKGWSD